MKKNPKTLAKISLENFNINKLDKKQLKSLFGGQSKNPTGIVPVPDVSI